MTLFGGGQQKADVIFVLYVNLVKGAKILTLIIVFHDYINIYCIVGIVYTAIWACCSFLKVFLYEEREGKKTPEKDRGH